MSAPSNPLSCFIHLCDAIPDWLSKLDGLTAQVAEQHSRFAQITQYPGVRLVRKKHDSTESLRPREKVLGDGDDAGIVVTETSVPSGPSHPSPNPDGAMILKDVRRKRKPNSSFSGASGPQRYRTRSMIVVYYDSVIQEAFEQMVRSIASARNQLRKGRTAASFKSRMACLGVEEDPFAAAGDFAMLNPKLSRPVGPRSTQAGLDALGAAATQAFDEADNDLLAAQSLCEVAAHQFLRDGDCNEEIQGTRKRLEHCLALAQKELETSRQKDEVPEVKMEDVPRPQGGRDDLMGKAGDRATKPVMYTGINAIEVDDGSDASSVEIDLDAFRRMRRV